MSKPDKYVPKHRAPGRHKAPPSPAKRAARTTLVLTGAAAVATGVAVTGGVASPSLDAPGDLAAAAVNGPAVAAAGAPATGDRARRTPIVSRSDRRGSTDSRKAQALSADTGPAVTRSQNLSNGDPRDIARALLPEFGYGQDQFSCLDSLYVSESDWRIDADNPTSSAYGIPQALTQLHDLPADYMTSAESQIRWGLGYIRDTYGTPCSAWSFKAGNGWY